MPEIDLNCDMGEGCPNDEKLMDYVSSINVACGFHAGNPTIMRQTVETARKKSVSVGAHPSYFDLENFGRTEKNLSPQEVFDIVLYQVSAFDGICRSVGVKMRHVKPHGALYNQSAGDQKLARAIAKAVKFFDENLILYGLSGSYLISEAEEIGLKTASEVFADRTYQNDGSLTSRKLENALITDSETAVSQVMEMIQRQQVRAVSGKIVKLRAETVCLHGDGKKALEFARQIRQKLDETSVKVIAP